jgi:amino acid transporter
MEELKRSLGFGTILFLTIASIMGSGIFFGAGIGASYSGNASILAWVILTLVAIYISTFFAELVALFPTAGGVYEFSKQAYGRFASFLMGWSVWIVGNLSTAVLIVAAIDYLIPDPSKATLKLIISISIIIVLNTITFFGVEISGILVSVLAILSIGIMLSIIFPGIFIMDVSNFTPFFSFGTLPIFITIFFLAESFFGWESTTFLAEETKNPEQVIPKAMIYGTVIVGILATLVTVMSLGIIPWKTLAENSAPLSLVFGSIYGSFGKFMNYGIFLSLIGAAAGGIVTMPRLILALARDKLFISQLADVHPTFKTPHKAIIFQTIAMLIVLGMAFGEYTTLLSLLLPLGLIIYIFTVLTVPIFRRKFPDVERSFKVPFANLGSFLVIVFLISLITVWITQEPNALKLLLLGLSFVAIGIPIYLLLEIYYNPDTIVKVNDALAYLTLLTEKIILPKKVRTEIFTLLGNIQGKTILEFGCSVGTLTLGLAERVGPSGRIYATDLSKKDLIITNNRMIKKGHGHVVVIHDEHQMNRVHPDVPHVDAIVSIGMMGYLQDVKKVLAEMRDLLPYKGKIVFVDYADFFKVIPNVAWLSDDKTIEKIFREAGFSVYVTRKKGLFWNYVYVYGIKFHENIVYV